MDWDHWDKIASVMDHIVVSTAALIGGVWAVFRFWRERTDAAGVAFRNLYARRKRH